MSDVKQGFTDEGESNEAELSTEQLDGVAGGAKRWSVCPKCGKSDQIVKKVRAHNIMYYYCNRCQITL